jgi:thymidylate kinase
MVTPIKSQSTQESSTNPEVHGRTLTRVVLAALDAAQVRWCLLRGLVGDGDVDVLVAAADLHRAVPVLEGFGLVRLRAYGRGSHKFFLGLDEITRSWVEFDLVTDLTFGQDFEVRTGAASACLSRRRREGGVWVLAPEDEFWALLLHCMLDKGSFAKDHGRRLGQLVSLPSLESPLVDAMPSKVRCETLVDDVRAGQWDRLVAASDSLLQVWRRAAPSGTAVARARSTALRLVERPLQAWSRRGLSVALLGPDGAGKSTLAGRIESTFYFPVRRIYMGLWPTDDEPRGPAQAVFQIIRRPFRVWRRYLAGLRHRVLGRLVLFDRYIYDASLPARGSLIWLKRPYFWMLSRSCPSPNLIILLDAPGEVLHNRSGEYAPAHLEAERQHYRRLARRMPQLVQVDSNRPPEVVVSDVMGHIWRQYQRRAAR